MSYEAPALTRLSLLPGGGHPVQTLRQTRTLINLSLSLHPHLSLSSLLPLAVDTLWQTLWQTYTLTTSTSFSLSPHPCHPPPKAVDTLSTYCGKEVPIKKLLLWLEMARQELPDPTAKIPLAAWQTVLSDLSS